MQLHFLKLSLQGIYQRPPRMQSICRCGSVLQKTSLRLHHILHHRPSSQIIRLYILLLSICPPLSSLASLLLLVFLRLLFFLLRLYLLYHSRYPPVRHHRRLNLPQSSILILSCSKKKEESLILRHRRARMMQKCPTDIDTSRRISMPLLSSRPYISNTTTNNAAHTPNNNINNKMKPLKKVQHWIIKGKLGDTILNEQGSSKSEDAASIPPPRSRPPFIPRRLSWEEDDRVSL
ncbi:hypothetical protein BX666DRAFT_720055 [Dichotomocladium elegans]|nr:hypothetical protein BX666DRAFT_720055 [Dichotomocladium elegans]